MTGDEILALAERLDDSASEHSRRAFSDRCVSPDCALSSNLATAAATALRDLSDRLAKAEADMERETRRAVVAEAKMDAWSRQVYLVNPLARLEPVPATKLGDPVPPIPVVERVTDLLDRLAKGAHVIRELLRTHYDKGVTVGAAYDARAFLSEIEATTEASHD